MGSVQAAAPHSKVMRTQMDVDYTGRVRQAPGANSIQTRQERHEVRDEEENEPLEAHEDEDEASDDWQARRVPEMAKPVLTAMTATKRVIKKNGDLVHDLGEEVIRQAAKVPWGHIDDKDSAFHNAEETIKNKVASSMEHVASDSDGVLGAVVDAADDLIGSLKQKKQAGDDSFVEKIKDAVPIANMADKAGNIAGQHFPKLIKDVKQDIKEGDAGKVLEHVQGHLENQTMELAGEAIQDQITNVMEMSPKQAMDIVRDAAQLAEDVRNLHDDMDSEGETV